MNKILKSAILIAFIYSCGEIKKNDENLVASSNPISDDNSIDPQSEWGDYWYAGKAELTSYKLQQARYGEIHEGHAVLIFVTEQFLPKRQLKADNNSKNNVPVLKLNSIKKYLTGIYPYSVMSSVFTPVSKNKHALKTTFSYQEWCGQTYVQLNNRDKFDIKSHSYFEENGDNEIMLDKDYLENDIWTKIRINPKNLPLGKIKMIPSLEFLSMQQKPIQAYAVTATLNEKEEVNLYKLEYPELKRTLEIKYKSEFPYTIEGWEDTYASDFSNPGVQLTSKAKRLKSIRNDYWNKHKIGDAVIRKELGF